MYRRSINKIERKEIIVYTAIFDGYDVLIDPKASPSCKYVCFTDNPDLTSDVWDTRFLNDDLSNTMKNRKVKILPHRYFPGFEYSVYVDGNVQILSNMAEKVDRCLSTNKMVVPKHPLRDCVYEEAKACINNQKADPQNIQDQMKKYREYGFPEHFGLSENKILFRRHNESIIKETMEKWWEELRTGARRDQLSLPFVMWKMGFDYQFMETNPRQISSDFRIHPHRPVDSGIGSWKTTAWKMFVYLKSNKDSNWFCSKLYKSLINLIPSLEQNRVERQYLPK